LIGDPARAEILTALVDGRAWTASEFALQLGIGAPTMSAHREKLFAGSLIAVVA
jgi:DNA-binding transcriptional ArsR family regulator